MKFPCRATEFLRSVYLIYLNQYLPAIQTLRRPKNNNKLLDEVEHDIMNYQSRGLCYLPQPSASADNTDTRV